MNDRSPSATTAKERWLVRLLWAFGLLDLAAFSAVLMPWSVMDGIHRACGLGELPTTPIVGYLARTASLLYALHGAVVLFVARDVRRYAPLVRFLAVLAMLQGAALILIDRVEKLPGWWQFWEGSCIAAIGGMVLLLQRGSAGPHAGKDDSGP